MYFIETILIGISLAMDAFAICLCQGLTTKENKEILALKLGITFGAFQAIMPWLGYSVGNIFSSKVSTYGNILAFIILLLIGINMIKEGKEEEKCEVLIGLKALLGLGIATSIDALAVGLSFAMNGQEKNIFISWNNRNSNIYHFSDRNKFRKQGRRVIREQGSLFWWNRFNINWSKIVNRIK